MIKNEKTGKLIASLVGYPITITLRSTPEILITGELSSYDFTNDPAIVTVINQHSIHIINWADISQITQKINGE